MNIHIHEDLCTLMILSFGQVLRMILLGKSINLLRPTRYVAKFPSRNAINFSSYKQYMKIPTFFIFANMRVLKKFTPLIFGESNG